MIPSTRGSVEFADGARLFVGLFADVHATAPEGVVADDETTRPDEAKRPLEVRGQRLFVGVEKHRVESLAVERRKHVQRASDAHLDAIAQTRAVDVLPRERRVFLLDLDAEQTAARRQ